MKPKRIALIAADVGETNLMELVRGTFDTPGIIIEEFFGNGHKPFPFHRSQMGKGISQSDFVLATMSEFAEPEVLAGMNAIHKKKPLGLIALGSGFTSWQNPAFPQDLREYVKLLFVITEQEVKEAQKRFPNALIISCGNPQWENFFEPLMASAEVRQKLNLADDQIFVLIIGDKKVSINLPMFVQTFEAICDYPERDRFTVACSVHPGHDPLPGYDRTPTDKELVDFYSSLLEIGTRDRGFTVGVSCKDNPYGIGAPQMIGGADIVIGGTSTELIRAASLRKRTIAALMHEAFPGIKMPLSSSGWWKPCDWKAMKSVTGLSSSSIESCMLRLMDQQGHEMQQDFQELVFPVQKPGSALATIRAAIKEVAGF